MKKCLFLFILLFLLLCGCAQEPDTAGIAFPFAVEDIVTVDAYSYLENFTDSARKKTAADAEDIQDLYTAFTSIATQPGEIDPDKYGANISAYRFHLKDGTSYAIVYKGYGVRDGILTTVDAAPLFTEADVNAFWINLSVDAESCSEEELPVPFRQEPVMETAAPKTYSGEEAEVHQLVFDFLTVKQVDFISEVDHSLADYLAPGLREGLEEQLFWKVFRFEKLVRYTMREKILWEEFDLHITDLQINGDNANVTAFDTYEYELANGKGIVSSRGTGYAFTCRKVRGTWYITEVDTDNELIEGHVDGYTAEELPALAGVSE